MKKFVARSVLVQLVLLGSLSLLWAQQEQVPADNTKVNQRDRNQNEPTADQQKENRSDRDLTERIRKVLMQDKSLSTSGHNIKVITQNGMVTLKGPVKSEDEKQKIEAKAAEIAGADKVTSELQIAPK